MTATEIAYNELLSGVTACNSIEQIKALVKQVLNIDENHLMFDGFVRKLCEKGNVDYYDNAVDTVTNYLHSMEGSLGLRAFIEKTDLKKLAKALVEKWNVLQSLTMSQFKKIARNHGYVVGPSFKSIRKLTAIIEDNL